MSKSPVGALGIPVGILSAEEQQRMAPAGASAAFYEKLQTQPVPIGVSAGSVTMDGIARTLAHAYEIPYIEAVNALASPDVARYIMVYKSK